ncbi:hypothetical protein F5Y13DRAFT_196513 [Hypoxylon sp. FL1857]|nr:hypothetical protein F5Y13DRAFT_196513 [Hypoxylon sp. FL1857]
MGTAIASDPLQQLGGAQKTAIADLGPELSDPASRAVRGVVTITWPYNSVKGTFAFILAEPDYRLRRSKGQIRINLTGASAKAAGESGLSSSDEVLVSLNGAEWVPEEVKKRQSLPGSGVDWQLKFSDKLLLQVTLAETGETRLITVDHHPPADPQPQAETPPIETLHHDDPPTQTLEALTPPSKTYIARLKDGEYESPAFIKRARMSYGSLFEDGYDIFEDDGGVKGRGRKRARFGRESGAWKYSSQSPSPEPRSPQSSKSPRSSPSRPEMTDEGCQTMELDFPMPSPMQASINTAETQNNSKPIPTGEHVAHSRQGMVDHGIQDDFHSGWPSATSISLPPFGPSGGIPSSGSEPPAFQSTDQLNAASNGFQQGWPPRSVDFPSEGYPHAIESAPPANFTDEYGDGRSVGLGHTRSGSRTRSPSEPNNLALEPIDHGLNGGLPAEEQSYPAPVAPQTTVYPPLDVESEEHTSSNEQGPGAHLDYPPAYLDNGGHFSQEAMDVDKSPFVPSTSAVADAASSLWTTINNPPQTTQTPLTDRLGSTEGESVENAIAIDDSDSDDGPPPPTAVEDTVMGGRADDLDMYDEAGVEDEVDAEFSDDDEPEYETEEIGGDYDTRNYTAPDDDEDDSHDEDLRSHNLEPEFDDGRSWEEGEDDDEDAENFEYESDYEMDEKDEEPQQQPRPTPQSAPQIIDLISSSEDEGDDEAHPPQPPSQPVPDSTLRSQPKTSPTSTANEIIGQGIDGESSEESIEGEDNEELSDEEESEEESEREDYAASIHSSERSESESLASDEVSDNESMKETLEGGHEGVVQATKDGDVVEPVSASPHNKSHGLESSQVNDFPLQQGLSLEPSKIEPIITQDEDGDERMRDGEAEQEEGDTDAPQSAAEGLEILSRAVESESNVNITVVESEEIRSDRIVDTNSLETDEPPPMDHTQRLEKQVELVSQDAQEDEELVDMVSTLPSDNSNLQSMAVEENKQVEAIAPSSPPLTHSFISQPTGEERMDVILQETVSITDTHIPADQLPTPRDTQLIGEAAVSDSEIAVSMEINELDMVTTEEPIDIIQEVPSTEQVMDEKESTVVVEEAITHIEERPVEAATPQRQQTPDEENGREAARSDHSLVSPSLSFQTQVDADDIRASYAEPAPKVVVETETEGDTHSDTDADISGASVSFRSQMEVDEELQASILEYSQEFEDANTETTDERGIDEQFENDEDEANLTDNDEARAGSEPQQPSVARAPSPELGTQESKRRESQQDISVIEQTDTPDQASQEDPSVQLARAANASKRNTRQHDTTRKAHEDSKKFPMVETSTPVAEDSSVQLARASFSKASQTEEDSNSMTAAKLKLVRHLRDELPDCTSLKVLRQHLQKKLDVIAVAMMRPPDPQRAKGGPREFMMSFTITDHSIGPHSVVEVQLYRPHKETLPIVNAGDVVLLRNFTVVSLQHKGFGLRTNDESSWAIFDHDDQLAQIKGPPVEYGEKETTYVANMRSWFNLLDEKARAKLERANQKIVAAGRSK